ncbi:MAG: saccharopine dehydrogenase NADP-binding domain-containing protein [Anaerolineales bacterium]|nr:saccharopine dehydrogenase NADP-binding domain-containing protein [Anaerolineales bacterium]
MKTVVLGGVGAMGIHTTPALLASGLFTEVVVADIDVAKARAQAAAWHLPPTSVVALDAGDDAALVRLMAGAGVVVNALPKPFVLPVARAALATRVPTIDLSSLSPALRALHADAQAVGALYVAGCGSSSGLTNMLAKHGARGLERVEAVDIAFASFRAIALSPASIRGVFWEFGPDTPRGYYADGAYQSAGWFEGARQVEFAPPIGAQTVYYVPHSEVESLPRNLGAHSVAVRGTFTPQAMRLMQALTDYGVFAPGTVQVAGQPVERRELLAAYLAQVPEARHEPVWGYGLHVEVTGWRDGRRIRRRLWTEQPSPETPGWSGPAAWARCVAGPFVAGALLLAQGAQQGVGVDAPEAFLPAEAFLKLVQAQGLSIHEQVEQVAAAR